MTPTRRGLVWVDHHEARIVHPVPESSGFDVLVVEGDADRPHEKKHDGGHRHPISREFGDRLAHALRPYTELAIVGPSAAKDELMHQLREHHHEMVGRVVALEPLDRSSDAELAAHARRTFDSADRMRGVHVARAGS
jgi:hypothetical protein